MSGKKKKNPKVNLKRKQIMEDQKAAVEKISELRSLLSDYTVDPERTILGSEPFLTPIINDKRREKVVEKVMELVDKLG